MRTTIEGGNFLPLLKFQTISVLIWNSKGRLCNRLIFTAMLIIFTQPLDRVNCQGVAFLSNINAIRCISHTLLSYLAAA
jgi:hypothetical protein